MKIRFARNRNLASTRMKRANWAALLFLLAFAVPSIDVAQEKSNGARASQPQSNPAPLPKSSNVGNAVKEPSGGKVAGALAAGAITDIKTAPDNSKLMVTVATNRLLSPQEFILEDPARLVLDFPNTENRIPFTQLPVHAAAVKRIRVQQFQSVPAPIARVVFDLEDGYGPHEIDTSKDGVRLVFHKDKGSSTATSTVQATPPAATKPVKTAEPALAKTSEPAPAPAISAEKTSPRVEPRKPVSPAGDLKPQAAENAPKITAPAAQPMPAKVKAPNQKTLARADATKAAPVQDPKPAAKVKNSASSNLKPPAATVDLPKTAEIGELKPLPIVQVAATPAPPSAPAVISPAPKMVGPSSARFSGQPLTLDLIDFPLVDFFRLMSEEGGINIVMDPEIKGRVSIKVVKVPWDQIFEAVLTNYSLDKQVDGSVVRIARKSTLQEEARQQESLKKANLLAADLETRIKRLNYAKANLLAKALEEQKTVRGTIVVEDRSNSLILTDIPTAINKLVNLIDALDTPQPQVEIEARIVSSTRDFARDIGIQFGFVDGNLQRVTVGGPNTFGTIGGTRPSATPNSTFAAGNGITGRGASQDTAAQSGAVSTGSNNKGNYNVNLPATKAFGGLGISIGNIFDTFLLDAAITAGESKGNAKLISQPKVVAQNNSPAVVTQGLRFPVQVVANNTISVQFQNAALTLTVTPQITFEGNIVLDLKVENNTPDFGRQVNGVPSIRTSESTTRVLVNDGGTIVFGGILIDDESSSEDKVPGLGSIPLVGNLFKRNSVSRATQEVLFFVTPRVIK